VKLLTIFATNILLRIVLQKAAYIHKFKKLLSAAF